MSGTKMIHHTETVTEHPANAGNNVTSDKNFNPPEYSPPNAAMRWMDNKFQVVIVKEANGRNPATLTRTNVMTTPYIPNIILKVWIHALTFTFGAADNWLNDSHALGKVKASERNTEVSMR